MTKCPHCSDEFRRGYDSGYEDGFSSGEVSKCVDDCEYKRFYSDALNVVYHQGFLNGRATVKGKEVNTAEYEEMSKKTATYPGANSGLIDEFMYLALGLIGEAGEISEKVKKYYANGKVTLDETDRAAILKETGDVLWYLTQLIVGCRSNLSEVMAINIDKLADRLQRGVIIGEGDDR